MARLISEPSRIRASGTKEKIIREYIGAVNTGTRTVSIARMSSPGGWEEPGQTPEFDEYTLVLEGCLRVETRNQTFDVCAGQAIIVEKNEWVRYSTPGSEGAEYVAICIPAFNLETVHRDADRRV